MTSPEIKKAVRLDQATVAIRENGKWVILSLDDSIEHLSWWETVRVTPVKKTR